MIPLIDTVFLILVFFIYAFLSMTVHKGLAVNLPHAGAAEINKKDYISITVTKNNDLYLDKQAMDQSQLAEAIRELHATQPSLHVYLNGDSEASHGVVVSVLDILKKIGVNKISIETGEKQHE